MPLLNGCQFLAHSTYSYTHINTLNHNNSSTGTFFFFETAIARGDFSKKNVFYHCQGTEKFELRKQLPACHRQGMGKRAPLCIYLYFCPTNYFQLSSSAFILPPLIWGSNQRAVAHLRCNALSTYKEIRRLN